MLVLIYAQGSWCKVDLGTRDPVRPLRIPALVMFTADMILRQREDGFLTRVKTVPAVFNTAEPTPDQIEAMPVLHRIRFEGNAAQSTVCYASTRHWFFQSAAQISLATAVEVKEEQIGKFDEPLESAMKERIAAREELLRAEQRVSAAWEGYIKVMASARTRNENGVPA